MHCDPYSDSFTELEDDNNNDNRVIVANDNTEKVKEIVVQFLEKTPGYSSNDDIAAYKVQKKKNSTQCKI